VTSFPGPSGNWANAVKPVKTTAPQTFENRIIMK
jgi:hypothetical protein